MKTILLAVLLLTSGCLAETTSSDTSPADACPEVECGWSDIGTCLSTDATFSSSQGELALQDDGASTCWYYDTMCIKTPTGPAPRSECIPAACRREMVTCQPTTPQGRP